MHSPDPDYLAKLATIRVHLRCARADPEATVVLFQDEFSYYRQPTLAPAYEQRGHVQPLAELSHGSNIAWRVAGALDAWTGRAVYTQRQQLRLRYLIAFYRQVREAYPQAKTIYLVQDSWPLHFHPDVLAALEPQRQPWPIHLPPHWPREPSGLTPELNLPLQAWPLPTYAAWANPIEKLWRQLKQEVLHLHRWADDRPGLREQVAHFLDRFGEGSPDLLRYVGLGDPEQLYHGALDAIAEVQPLRC
ncbi:MAG: hypothetical protein GXY79_10560 [Chloroflexi bacterium]|nr:hypothetical protein [Chloroflexota bacterium]